MSIKRVLGLMVMLAALSARAEASTIALSFVSENSGFADGAPRMLGWQFTVNSTPISVSALGFHDYGQDGLAGTHQVGIWRTDGTLVTTIVVQAGTSSSLTNYFRFEALPSPVVLSANTTYIIAGYDSGTDRHVWDVFLPGYGGYEVSGFGVDSAITIGAAGSAFGGHAFGGFAFPGSPIGGGDTRHALIGPNFLIGSNEVTPVPEPASLALLGAGLALATRRLRK